MTMTNKKKIAADLQSALFGQSPLSIDLYVEVLADYEDELKASLDKDADDALLCVGECQDSCRLIHAAAAGI
jgi:hypothetical protein